MYQNGEQKHLNFLKKIWNKIKPRFSFHYVAYSILFFVVAFMIVNFVSATTPNPGHPWSELGDGVFTFTSGQTSTPYTYTFPAANTAVLTTNSAVTVGQGGTGLTTIPAGSVFAANTLDTFSAVTSTSGTKVLTNTAGTITWEAAASGMTWPSGGAGIPNYTGSSSWGTSYTTSGSGTVLALVTSPVFVTPTLGAASATTINGLTLTSASDGFTIAGGTTPRTLTVTGGNASVTGTNTGDETQSTIKTKLGAASSGVDGYLSGTDWNTFNGKESALTFSTGLTRNTNTITNNLSTGIAGSQSVVGGTAASETLTLSSTSNATKGKILFGTSAYDEVNNRLGIGVNNPSTALQIKGATSSSSQGANQVINGTFDTNLNSWTATTWTSGSARANYTGTTGPIDPNGFQIDEMEGDGNYQIGDVLTLVGGGNNATITLTDVDFGIIFGYELTSQGTGYSVDVNNPLSTTGGSGTGATFIVYKLADSSNTLSQNVSVSAGTYLVSYTVGRTAGELKASLGGVLFNSGVVTSGTKTQLVNTTGTGDLIFTPTADFSGYVDSISVKQVTAASPVISLLNDDGSVGMELRSGGSFGSPSRNTLIGVDSGYSITDGRWNTAVGYQSLMNNDTGANNSAFGYRALYNTRGMSYHNTGIGNEALYSNTTGDGNIALGSSSLYSNTTGNNNVAVGPSLQFNTTGDYNTALGSFAGNYISGGSIENTTGDYNIFIGRETKALADNDQNEIVVGYNTVGNGSNTTTIGNTSNLRTYLTGVNLKAGTATAGTAPLKLTSGTVLTTTEAGAIEFNNDSYYGTITTGAGTAGARKTFAFTDSNITGSAGSVTGLTLTTNLTNNGGVGTLTWPAAGATLTIPTGGGTLGSAAFTNSTAYEVPLTFSTGLTRSTNTITNNLSTGIAGSQSVVGGTAASEILTLSSTSNATKGKILFGTSGYDEVNNRLGVGTASPTMALQAIGNVIFGTVTPTYIPAVPLNLVNSAGATMRTQLNLVNTGGGSGAGSAIDFYTYDVTGGTSPGLRIAGIDNNYSADFAIYTKVPGAAANALDEKFRITNNGNTGIGVIGPTAALHLKAGTATANTAPLKLTSGTALGTTEAGAIEFHNGHLYFTAVDAGTRYQLDQQSSSGGLTVGTSAISNGTNGRILYNNSGILGEMTTTGSGTVVALATTPTFTTNITTPLVIGGTGASGTLTFSSTSDATKGKILFGTSGYDEVNNRLGVGNSSPTYPLDVTGDIRSSTGNYLTSATNNIPGYSIGQVTFGVSTSGNSLIVNDINGAKYALATGGYDLTFLKHKADTDTYIKSFVIEGDAANNNPQGYSFYTGTTQSVVIDSAGDLGVGVVGPTAALHLRAGTATANTAPLKFTSSGGALLGTTEAGAMEFDGTHLYFTLTNGGTRYQLDQQSGGSTSLQTAYNTGGTIETAAGIPVLITETGAVASTHNLLGLTVNPATAGTFTGDALNIVMDAVDLGANTGNGLHIVVDQSQATGFPILVEDDAGVDILALSQTSGLIIGSATNRLNTTTYGDFIAEGSDLQTALSGIIDIQVYDTSRDADGGEWRNSLLSQQHSWYGETKDDGLNDSCVLANDDRCGTSEFPRKVILVTTASGLYIFNASNNLLWMKFTQAGTYALGADTNNNPSGVDAQNGVIVVGTNGTAGTGMYAIDFKQDAMYRYSSTNRSQGDKNIANRNSTVTYNLNTETNLAILDNIVNDVSIAMQTGSNEGAAGTLIAPIDSQAGPVNGVTLIGAATDTGVSVVHIGGPREVFNYSDATGNDYNQIYVTARGRMYATNEALAQLEEWRNIDKDVVSEVNGTPDAYFDETSGRGKISLYGVVPTISTSPSALAVVERGSAARESSTAGQIDSGDIVYVGTNQGLAEIHTSGGLITLAAWSKVTTKDTTTPYMVGPVRGAYLFNDTAGSTFALNGTSTSTTNRMQSPIVGTSPTFGESGVRGNSVNFNNNSYFCSDSTNDGICDGNTNFNAGLISFTVSLWFKHGTTAAADTLFERCYTPATPTAAACIYAGMTSTGAIRFAIDDDATWTYATTYDDSILSTALYNDNQWHHAVFTNTDSDICMYIDGRQAAACDTSFTATLTLDAAQVLTIGGTCSGANCVTGTNFWDGSIDDFVWSSGSATTNAGTVSRSASRLYLDGRAHLIRPVADVSDSDIFSSTTIGKTGQTYTPGSFVGLIVELDGGTGNGQTRTIISNTATTFTVYPEFATTPDATTDYKVNAGRLFGASNNVTAISADLPTSLNKIRKIYVGTNDGADGGGITVFTNAGAGSIKTEVIHSDAGYSSDDYGNSWSGVGADNITGIGSYSDTAVFGNGAFFRSLRKDISLKQLQTDTIASLEDLRMEMVAKGLFGSTQDVLGLGQGADLAEYYYSNTPLEAGDVVAIQPDQPAGIGKSDSRYQKNLLGVVSTRPGLTLGPVAENAYPIALGGRIPVKITNENGEIHVGDMLTSSSKDGYAMKATTAGQVLGRVINEPEEMASCSANTLPAIGDAVGDGPGVTGITDVVSTDSSILNDEEITDDEVTLEDEEDASSNEENKEDKEEIKVEEDKGNKVNADNLKCGYAMLFVGLSDSLGSDVVKLAEEYATAKGLNNLIEEDEEGLEIDVISEDLEGEEEEDIDERRFILDFLQAEKKSRFENGFDLQSIYTDRLAAAIQIVTPEVITDDLFVGNIAEFALPPLFNKDTAGFALIKKGDRRVRINFENPYIAEPAVGAMMVFNASDDFTDTEANNIFDNKIESMVVDSDQNGFTILINKDAPRDLRYAWNAFAVKDAEIFESVIEGLTIEMETDEPAPDTELQEESSDSNDLNNDSSADQNVNENVIETPNIDTILDKNTDTPVILEEKKDEIIKTETTPEPDNSIPETPLESVETISAPVSELEVESSSSSSDTLTY